MTWQGMIQIWEGTIQDPSGGILLELDTGRHLALSMDPRDDVTADDLDTLWKKVVFYTWIRSADRFKSEGIVKEIPFSPPRLWIETEAFIVLQTARLARGSERKTMETCHDHRQNDCHRDGDTKDHHDKVIGAVSNLPHGIVQSADDDKRYECRGRMFVEWRFGVFNRIHDAAVPECQYRRYMQKPQADQQGRRCPRQIGMGQHSVGCRNVKTY